MTEFLPLLSKNNLGHEICNNIRSGDWLIDYTYARLLNFVPSPLSEFIKNSLDHIKKLPRGIIPKHFVKFIIQLFQSAKKHQIQSIFQLKINTKLEEYLYTSVTQF